MASHDAAANAVATPATLAFNYTIGTTAPAAQQVQVATTGNNVPISATASTKDGANWRCQDDYVGVGGFGKVASNAIKTRGCRVTGCGVSIYSTDAFHFAA